MATILITSPSDDEPKSYGRYYLRSFARDVAGLGYHVVLMRQPLLYNFHEAILKYNPRLVIVNGHGGRKGVTGLDAHVILGVKSYDPELKLKIEMQNPQVMRGRMVYLLSCFSGAELGLKLAQYGAEAVAGYKSSFIFLSKSSPENDYLSETFFTGALQLPLALALGRTFGQGCAAVKDTFYRYVEMFESQGNDLMAKYLWHDYLNFTCYGSMRAVLI